MCPVTISMTKERKNAVLAGALPSLRAVADLHHVQVRAVLRSLHSEMRASPGAVAKKHQRAQQQSNRIAFGMGLNRAHDIAGKPDECLRRHNRKIGDLGPRIRSEEHT